MIGIQTRVDLKLERIEFAVAHFRIRGEIIIILRFERRVFLWASCRMHQFKGERKSGLQTLIVKSRLLTGENSVRIRGDPPFKRRVYNEECRIQKYSVILSHSVSSFTLHSAFSTSSAPVAQS